MTRVRPAVVLVLVAMAATIGIARAQTPRQPAAPAFDAAAIKVNRSSESAVRYETPPGRLNAVNVPLRFVIRRAYGLPDSRIVGGPAWLDDDRFDIVASAGADASTPDEIRQMVKALLADRFQLKARLEVREMAIYSLVQRDDGAFGPHLNRSTTDCGGPDAPPRMAAGRVVCGLLLSQGPASASLRGGATTFADFVRILGEFLERPLVDHTGLTGPFDLALQFTATRGAMPGAGTPGGLTAAGGADEIPTVFTAVQEQLGLRLVAERGRVEVLVVESVSRPSEN